MSLLLLLRASAAITNASAECATGTGVAQNPTVLIPRYPPILVDSDIIGFSVSVATGSPVNFKSITVAIGDVLTVGMNIEDNTFTEALTNFAGTATTSAWTRVAGTNSAGNSRVGYWVATVTGAGTLTVRVTISGGTPSNSWWGGSLRQWRNSEGAGASFAGLVQSNNLTEQKSDSTILVNVSDWDATNPGTPTWNGGLTTVTSGRDTGVAHYAWALAKLDDADAVSTTNYGLATPTFTSPAMAMLEVLGSTVFFQPDTNALAECATGTGTADNPVPAIAVNAEGVAGTGAANSPVPMVGAAPSTATGIGAVDNPSTNTTTTATTATGTGVASNATPAVAVVGDEAVGTGVANDATVSVTSDINAPAEPATGTGAANNPAATLTVNAQAATGTGTVDNTTPLLAATTGFAAGTGTADNPATATTTTGSVAAGVGTAGDATAAVAVAADQAAGTGTAFDPTISTETLTNASAQSASGTGAAGDSALALTVNAEAAAGSGSVPDPAARIAPTGTVATGTGLANNTSILTGAEPTPQVAVGTGTALDPAIAIAVSAEPAPGIGEAFDPSLVKPILAEYDVGGSLTVSTVGHGALVVVGVDGDSLLAHTVGHGALTAVGTDVGSVTVTGLS